MARKIKSLGVKMVISGESSNEIFGGYLYFHKAPSKEEFFGEACHKIKVFHQYDCLRANKATFAWGLESGVPFLDKEFINVAMRIDPKWTYEGALSMARTFLEGEDRICFYVISIPFLGERGFQILNLLSFSLLFYLKGTPFIRMVFKHAESCTAKKNNTKIILGIKRFEIHSGNDGFPPSVDSRNSVKLLKEELRGLKIKRDEIRRMNCKRASAKIDKLETEREQIRQWGYSRIITRIIVGGVLGFYAMQRAELMYKEMWNRRSKKYEEEFERKKMKEQSESQESL